MLYEINEGCLRPVSGDKARSTPSVEIYTPAELENIVLLLFIFPEEF